MAQDFKKLPAGEVIRDTYTIESVLGEGAFGVVYKVRHKFLGFQALKVFHPEKVSQAVANNFLNEAVILSKITHPNVVRVFEANHFDLDGTSVAYVVMEYVPSGTLAAYIHKKAHLEPPLAIAIILMICRGLAQVHQLNPPIIHRDIKPHNIMLDTTTVEIIAKVSDFGQAQPADPVTLLAQSAGTLAYMAPEGFWNYKSLASDVYSVGMIFYMLLTGTSPFKMPPQEKYSNTKEVERAVRKSRSVVIKRPSTLREGLDRQLDQIVLKSLAYDAENRYQNAQEFLLALEEYQFFNEKAFQKRMAEVLALGRQFRDLPDAIFALEAVLQSLPQEKKPGFLSRYGVFLESWRKGIIL